MNVKEHAFACPYTEKIAEYAAHLRFEDLPPAVVDAAKTVVLDTAGALLLGALPQYGASRLTGDLAREMGGRPESTIIGRGFKAPCESAALANGTMGYAADIEGGSAARQHVPAVLVPAALAVGERQKADGRTFLAALAVGYEVCCRVGEACRTPHSYPHAFHPSATFGYFGAAAAAGRILGLGPRKFAHALGLAGSNAGGLMTWVTDPTEHARPFVIGMAARGGVTAALLAEMGMGGPPGILDAGKYSIYAAYAGEMHLDRLTHRLGEEFWIANTGGFKRYPCCGDIHSGLDALLALRSKYEITPEQIERITHRVKADRAPVIDNNPLKSHCAQYILAVAAVEGQIAPEDILQDRRDDPTIRAVFERVRLVADPEMDGWPAAAPALVEMVLKDGRRVSERVDWAKGRRENPMTADELEGKFYDLATRKMSRGDAHRLMEMIQDLEHVDNVCHIGDLLRG